MHFQPGQAKLIQVVSGEIYDVFVDIRSGSPTFGKWEGIYLNQEQRQQLFIPDGFAHGFYVLSQEAYLIFMIDQYYTTADTGFRFDDPTIGITWPLKGEPILSIRDQTSLSFKALQSRISACQT